MPSVVYFVKPILKMVKIKGAGHGLLEVFGSINCERDLPF